MTKIRKNKKPGKFKRMYLPEELCRNCKKPNENKNDIFCNTECEIEYTERKELERKRIEEHLKKLELENASD